jgi:hypothetical protein
MTIKLINPLNGETLEQPGDYFVDPMGNSFPIIRSVPRIAPAKNYTQNFGIQWNKFAKTQLDRDRLDISKKRFLQKHFGIENALMAKMYLKLDLEQEGLVKLCLSIPKLIYGVSITPMRFRQILLTIRQSHRIAFTFFKQVSMSYLIPDNSFDKAFCFGCSTAYA